MLTFLKKSDLTRDLLRSRQRPERVPDERGCERVQPQQNRKRPREQAQDDGHADAQLHDHRDRCREGWKGHTAFGEYQACHLRSGAAGASACRSEHALDSLTLDPSLAGETGLR